jgi:hypothetical protein
MSQIKQLNITIVMIAYSKVNNVVSFEIKVSALKRLPG